MTGRVVIVGAGLGGLSAACHLAGRGVDVTVLERSDHPGGRAGLLERDGYRFDTGPAVLTMLGVMEDTFAAAGADLDDHLDLIRLDPAYRARFADGSSVPVRASQEDMREELRVFAGESAADGFDAFVAWLRRLFDLEFTDFIDRDYSSLASLLRQPAAVARLAAAGGFGRLQPAVDRFFDDPRLQRLFSFQAMYAGMSPMRALAMYSVITYLDTVQGVYFPRGGVHELASGLARAARDAGADLRLGVEVEAITPAGSGVPARVHTSGGTLDAEAIVANPDLPAVYDRLVEVDAPRRLRRGHYSPSCLLWLVGGRRPDGAAPAHHTIDFGAAWSRTFAELLDEGRPQSDPSRFVTTPSVTDPGLAPAGRDVLHVLEPVPNLQAGLDWRSLEPQLTERMLTWLSGSGHLEGSPEVLHSISPVDWAAQGMAAGTPFSLDHRFTQTGPLRPALTDRRLPGVVFVGSSTRPGVGVPMVLLSGRLAADRVMERLAPRSAGSHRPGRQRPGWQDPGLQQATSVAERDRESPRAS
ncbi:MAG: phytoene desaturase family protein [Nitriliruptoraceae bacterium]